MSFIFGAPAVPSVEIEGRAERFAVRRIYCVGRNYAEHVREMGKDPAREAPFFFTKPADAVVADGSVVPYAPRTSNFHHEIELVIAIGQGGRDIPLERALEHVFGYAVGIDLTRRDLQLEAREKGRPWDASKAFDRSAPISSIQPAEARHLQKARIWLEVNGERRQQADIADMIWNVPEIITELSSLFELAPGDLIYTGTPAGVGAVTRGDRIEGGIEGIGTVSIRIA